MCSKKTLFWVSPKHPKRQSLLQFISSRSYSTPTDWITTRIPRTPPLFQKARDDNLRGSGGFVAQADQQPEKWQMWNNMHMLCSTVTHRISIMHAQTTNKKFRPQNNSVIPAKSLVAWRDTWTKSWFDSKLQGMTLSRVWFLNWF